MENLYLGMALGAALTAVLIFLLAAARAGGAGNALSALTLAGRAAADPDTGRKVAELLAVDFYSSESATLSPPPALPSVATAARPVPPAPAVPPPPPQPSADGLRLLGLLQTEARLVDFLMEDIAPYSAEQIGNSVRKIHQDARRVLLEHVTLGEILSGAGGDRVTVPVGFDPGEVRVVGNVTGTPPFTGTLEHPGWKVRDVKLPPPAAGVDPRVIQPAEVQMG